MELIRPIFQYNSYQERYNGINLPDELWSYTLEKYLWEILEVPPIAFRDLEFKKIPKIMGVYLITDHRSPGMESVIYVGKSKNIRKRIYSHIMGNQKNSPMLQYIISDHIEEDVIDRESAIDFILNHLRVRWLECHEDWDDPIKLTGYVEAYLTAKLKPLYGINLEK